MGKRRVVDRKKRKRLRPHGAICPSPKLWSLYQQSLESEVNSICGVPSEEPLLTPSQVDDLSKHLAMCSSCWEEAPQFGLDEIALPDRERYQRPRRDSRLPPGVRWIKPKRWIKPNPECRCDLRDRQWHRDNCMCPCGLCKLEREQLASMCRHSRLGPSPLPQLSAWDLDEPLDNPDEQQRRLERSFGASGSAEDWTRAATAALRAGQLPPPPPWLQDPPRFMSEEEIRAVFERARSRGISDDGWEGSYKVEATYLPGREALIGWVNDWPKENVPLGGPYWTRTRFFVGRSMGRTPVLLQLPSERSYGGDVLDPKRFVHARVLQPRAAGRGVRWNPWVTGSDGFPEFQQAYVDLFTADGIPYWRCQLDEGQLAAIGDEDPITETPAQVEQSLRSLLALQLQAGLAGYPGMPRSSPGDTAHFAIGDRRWVENL